MYGHDYPDVPNIPPYDDEPHPAPTSADMGADLIRSKMVAGSSFVLDIPERIPALWGHGDDVLWAEGEALILCGPAGAGKTSLAGQLVRARILGGDVLGYPVQPTKSRVLYLAMDRPRQIARALNRTLQDVAPDVLDDRLTVWPGPPLADVAKHPETLLAYAQAAGADTIVVDSIKDAAVGLSSDDVGAGYNRARQMCVANGVEVLELHHMVKKTGNGEPPKTLADLYGSVWIGAGAGSVFCLYGDAGDPIVSLTHLKPAADIMGPYQVLHDHAAGVSTIYHSTDLLSLARAAGAAGITARQAAQAITGEDKPNASQIEKARRRLTKLAGSGQLVEVEGARGGESGSKPGRWITAAESNHGSNHGRDWAETNHGPTDRSRDTEEPPENGASRNHGSNHGNHAASNHAHHPPFKGGERERPTCGHSGCSETARPNKVMCYLHHTWEPAA